MSRYGYDYDDDGIEFLLVGLLGIIVLICIIALIAVGTRHHISSTISEVDDFKSKGCYTIQKPVSEEGRAVVELVLHDGGCVYVY